MQGARCGLQQFEVIGEIQVEQHARDNLKRDAIQFRMQVPNLSGAPAPEHLLRALDHYPTVSANLSAVKRRLQQPSLTPPQFPFAGQQTLAEEAPIHAYGHALGEVLVPRSQDV